MRGTLMSTGNPLFGHVIRVKKSGHHFHLAQTRVIGEVLLYHSHQLGLGHLRSCLQFELSSVLFQS